MMENKNNVEVIAEQNEEIAVSEKKEGIVKKAGKWIKANGLKVVAVGAAGVVGFLAGAYVTGKSEDCESEDCDCDVIDSDDFTVEDAE